VYELQADDTLRANYDQTSKGEALCSVSDSIDVVRMYVKHIVGLEW
jgi:hypothetical protein